MSVASMAREPERAPSSSLIDFESVELEYRGKTGSTLALSGTSFSVGEGEIVAVVGPSGCGKSTIVKLVSGLIMPTRGSVTVDGAPVAGPLGIVGIAFQNPVMLPWLRTIDNVLLPLKVVKEHRHRFRKDYTHNRERAMELLRTVGLDGFENKYPWQLSGGMRQRASLCRALVHEPRLLLLDEPFAALDAFTKEELWGVLQDLWIQRKPTIVLITHDLREAVLLAHRVYVMSARPGRILHEERVEFPRPRNLNTSFREDFVDIVQRLRMRIEQTRNEAMGALPTNQGAGP